MNYLLSYIRLPDEVSPTEKAHVEKINRVALFAFYAHIPVFAFVAWMCDTGPWFAITLSVVTLIGPTVAYFMMESHRSIATVFGFTAMCMGGLLVHFGQGPMQIEMHFYFFVLLALLATYGNPVVNVTAAATAAVHHLALWLLLPASVFNYDASVWVVAVHALFVVIETVAAVFIARSFYDNVIGLEKIVAARTREVDRRNKDMRLVLDHVAQGLVTIELGGQVSAERSRKVDEWLGAPPPSGNMVDWLGQVDANAAAWLQVGLEELAEDILPEEVVIDQLPKRFRVASSDQTADQTYSMTYRPIHEDEGPLAKLLVVITDITAELRQAESEAEQRENLRLFEILASDPSGFHDFFGESSKMVERILSDADISMTLLKRLLHTVKGNTSLFGLDRIARLCHELEDSVESSGERPGAGDVQRLRAAWQSLSDKVEQLSGEDRDDRLTVDRNDLDGLLHGIQNGEDPTQLELRVKRMHLEPSARRLALLAEQAQKIAHRVGRQNIEIHHGVESDIRLDPEQWTAFWSSMVHVFRNAVDHGLETEAERQTAGKSERGQLALRTYSNEGRFVFEVKDDGRGIDLSRLAKKAAAKGLPHDSSDDVIAAIFADGVTTKESVTELSGRGVGMSAVKAEVEALGGVVEVTTEAGRGTRFCFSFPMNHSAILPPPSAESSR